MSDLVFLADQWVTRATTAEAELEKARITAAYWKAEHVAANRELATLRQRHAEAVEKAYREALGYSCNSAVDVAWLASDAKKRLGQP